MKAKTVRVSILCFIIYLSPLVLHAKTSLWKISADSSTVYIGGTIHLLRTADYPLPEEFDAAYKVSDTIVLEIDPGNANINEIMADITPKSMYSDGSSLETVLSSETYANLKMYCDGAGMPVAVLKQFKPSFAILTLEALEMQKLGVTEGGVDLYYQKKAVKEGKTIIGLETMEEQMEILLSLGDGYENEFVSSSIKGFKDYSRIIDESVSAWRNGDDEILYRLTMEESKKDTPDLYNKLIVERNIKWLGMIEDILQNSEKTLILVGVGHLIGEDGIIKKLKKRGYKIERVE